MIPRLLALLPVTILLIAGPAGGQQTGRVPYGGSEYFRFALFKHGLKPASVPDEALHRPHESVIVIVGDPSRIQRLLPGHALAGYLDGGGSILVATDGPVPVERADWADRLGIRITGEPVTADPEDSYRGERPRPFIKPKFGVRDGVESPFYLFEKVDFTGPGAVATDRPCAMSIRGDRQLKYDVWNLAGYPDTARLRDGQPLQAAERYFAVSLRPKERSGNTAGRLIVLADHGVLVNGMMGFEKAPATEKRFRVDNGNWAFANRTIEWLQGGFDQPRSTCLFVENGNIIDRFAIELPPNAQPPMPNIPPDVIANLVLNHANAFIDERQERDVFNQSLDRWLGLPRLLRLFLIGATVAFIFVCLRWLLRGQRKPDAAAAMTPAARDSLLPTGGVLRQRTGAQLEVGNLYEAARRRVRERFDVLGGRPGPSGEMPPVLTANDLPDGPLLHQSVRWLWALGYGDAPIAVPPADWDRTNVLLERVTTRAARGDWSFGQDAD